MKEHFRYSKSRPSSARTAFREGVLPVAGIVGITVGLVAVFAAFIMSGKNLGTVFPPHVDEGESVDPNPMRLIFMILAFLLSFVFASIADRKGKQGGIWPAFWLGYTGGTLLWQSVGESSWHFGLVCEDYLVCFAHLETSASLMLVLITTILLVYCARRRAFSWGVWIFVLSFVGNWFGHFVQIGTYPLVSSLMGSEQWYLLTGLIIGTASCLAALWLNFRTAITTKARLCCSLMLYFGLGIIVTGLLESIM